MDITYPITIAVVDDHPLVRQGMSDILMRLGFSVIIEAENGRELLVQLAGVSVIPDICLLDINMPIMNGMETAIVLKQIWPDIKIVGYTFNDEQSSEMIRCGANVCLQKGCDVFAIKRTILELFSVI